MSTRPASLCCLVFAIASLILAIASGAVAAAPRGEGRQDSPPANGPEVAPPLSRPPPSRAETNRYSLLARAPKPGPAGFMGDPYPFDTCCVDGKPLGPTPVVEILTDMDNALEEGRQVKFCSDACKIKFHADLDRSIEKLDQQIIAAFSAEYPIERCFIIMENKIGPDAVMMVLGNRIYKASTDKCLVNIERSWGRYATAYDKNVTVKQRGHYPFDTCLVTGKPLPETPYDLVIGSHLFRLTDEEAAKAVLNDPLPYIAKLKAAKAAAAEKQSPSTNGQSKPSDSAAPAR